MRRVTDITQQNSHLPKSNGHDHTTACILGHTGATFKMYAEVNTCYGPLSPVFNCVHDQDAMWTQWNTADTNKGP